LVNLRKGKVISVLVFIIFTIFLSTPGYTHTICAGRWLIIYICSNPDRLKLGKSKYGYVNIANRLTDSTEQFSDLSTFTRVWSFKKMDKYNEEYSIIDGLISFACRNI